MGIKKPSKSKLKREAKRKAKEVEAQAPIEEQVEETVEQSEDEEEEVPLAVSIDEDASDLEELAEGEEDDSDAEEVEDEEEDEEDNEDEEQPNAEKQREAINDEEAMIRITKNLQLKGLPWIETMTVTSSQPVVIEDIKDDMARELAFYQQALEAATIGREKVLEAGVAFTRPDDYFAEMLKSDEHMAKIRQRLVNEEARIKSAEDAKKQRLLKKFGKKVQVQKQMERQKQKTETLEKIKLLKRKRKDGGDLTTNDDFDIALDKADPSPANKKQKVAGEKGKKMAGEKGKKRQTKDAKYGFGGRKRNLKSNTAESSAELGGYNKMKGKPLYLGKGKGMKRK